MRDFLLSKPTIDVDICSKLPANEVINLLSGTEFKTMLISEKLGTVLIMIDNEKYEYTPFRRDNYAGDGSHSPTNISFNASLADDALRRDFTINAIYYDIENKQIIDPFNGRADLENRILKTVRSSEEVFKEDALRIFRLIRFAVTYGFDIEEDTLIGAKKSAELIKNLSSERVVEEFRKTTQKVETSALLEYTDLLGDVKIIENLYGKTDKQPYKLSDGLIMLAPKIEILYLMIFERYFAKKVDFTGRNPLSSLQNLKESEKELKEIILEIFGKDRLSNKLKRNIVEIITFSVLFFEAKNDLELDSLICRYYNIITSLIMGKESKIMVKNQAFTKVIDRLNNLDKPLKVTELNITSNQLVKLGVKKSEIGKVLEEVLFAVQQSKVSNQTESIIRFIKGNK